MRVIENYNPNDITMDFINSPDWDYIVLNKKINKENIKQYWNDVYINLPHLRFNFVEHTDLIKKPESFNGTKGYYTNQSDNKFHNTELGDKRKISSYTFAWPVQKNIPLPPPWAADINMFPELSDFIDENNEIKKDVDPHTFVMLEQYMFGEFETIWNDWGKNYLVNTRITMHEPEMIVPLHSDGYTCRIHIPMTEDSSLFYWGECWNRSYKWEPGNIYLINSHITHSTTNFGPNIRANILCSIDDNKILDLLKL
jgi:hypothetical protein